MAHEMSAPYAAPAPGWMLDELASAGRENLDPDHVARYDGKMDAGAAGEVALLQSMGLSRTSVVVDIGAGTGQFTLAAAGACARLIAVDVSPAMLARLQRRVGEMGLDNVDVVRGGFLTYVHKGDSPDVVYSRYALHHLPDFWKAVALSRIRAMMAPGGLLRLSDVVWNFGPEEAPDRIEAWCATAGTRMEGEWSREELEEHVRDEHSTFTWLLEPMIERAGFEIEVATHSADGVDAQYVLRAR